MADEGPGSATLEAPSGSPQGDPGESPVPQSDPGSEPEAPDAGVPDEDDESEFEDPAQEATVPYKDDPYFKSFKQRSRRIEKEYKKLRAAREFLKESGLSAQELVYQARTAQALNEQMARNPKLRALVYGEPAQDDQPLRAPVHETPDWNDDEYPYETETREGKWMRDRWRAAQQFQRTAQERLRLFEDTLDRVVSHVLGGERRAQAESWTSAVQAAAGKLPEFAVVDGQRIGLRNLFRDNCLAALDVARNTPNVKIDNKLVHRIIEHYLPSSGVTANSPDGRRAHAAAAQRMAEQNKTLPKSSAVVSASGQAVPAKAGQPLNKLSDFNNELKKRFG